MKHVDTGQRQDLNIIVLDLRVHLCFNCGHIVPDTLSVVSELQKLQGGCGFLPLPTPVLNFSVVYHGFPNTGSVARHDETESIAIIHISI